MPPNYRKTGKKGSSGQPYFDLIGADQCATKKKVFNIMNYFELPAIPDKEIKLNLENKTKLGK